LADTVSLVTLADDLLAIARSEHRRDGAPRVRARFEDVVSDAVRMARGHAEAGGVDVVTLGEGLEIDVLCSPKDVARALRNLLDNAIAHSSPGQKADVRAEPMGEVVAVVVEDEGAGVPSEDAPLLFAPLWAGGERARGRGSRGGARSRPRP